MDRLDVFYGNELAGALSRGPDGLAFEYKADFLETGHELSPLHLPLGTGRRVRREPPGADLPGLCEDSLPDAWGWLVMDSWWRERGRDPATLTPLERLAFLGQRTLGALSYAPALDVPLPSFTLAEVATAADQLEAGIETDLGLLAAVAASAGGARPKATLWFDPLLEAVAAEREGACSEPWLVKFGTAAESENVRVEFAYSLMAQAAGIDMPETRLLRTDGPSGPRTHLAVRRFDRFRSARVHCHSLAGLCERRPVDFDYRTFLRVTQLLTGDPGETVCAFRRAVFNVLAGNRDDHGRNHAFIYAGRRWQLSPAFDITFGSATQFPERRMAVMGERLAAGRTQLQALAEAEHIESADAAAAFADVEAALARWPEFADAAGVSPEARDTIMDALAR